MQLQEGLYIPRWREPPRVLLNVKNEMERSWYCMFPNRAVFSPSPSPSHTHTHTNRKVNQKLKKVTYGGGKKQGMEARFLKMFILTWIH